MRVGERKLIRYEAPEGRRVNVVGAYAPYDPKGPRLIFETRRKEEGRYDAQAHLHFVTRKVAGVPDASPEGYVREKPCVIVLDNYSVHKSQLVKERMSDLERQEIHFFFLPPYSPKLNRIEPIWRQVKYQDLPDRSHGASTELQTAVEDALSKRAASLRTSSPFLSRPA
jgi:putative transposase